MTSTLIPANHLTLPPHPVGHAEPSPDTVNVAPATPIGNGRNGGYFEKVVERARQLGPEAALRQQHAQNLSILPTQVTQP